MDFDRIRTLTITALFSDDELFEIIVLKGGNALTLVYGLSSRASLDLDFSIEHDFTEPDRVAARISRALQDRFSGAGLVVFDERFEPRPSTQAEGEMAAWGGYRLAFKLVERERYNALSGDIEAIRREALEIGPAHLRTFTVDFSKFEYCGEKQPAELDDFTIYVYSPAMLAIEKLRAICQQMAEYPLRRTQQRRARDFYDIHQLVVEAGVNVSSVENIELMNRIFAAKRVPVGLLRRVSETREFHRPDWLAVEQTVKGTLKRFDYYFDFVVNLTEVLETAGVI